MKETYVYVAKVEDYCQNDILPEYTIKEISKLSNQTAINQKKAVYGLLRKAVKEEFGIEDDFKHISKNLNGKPVGEKYHFSISHSKELVSVAISPYNIGIDIEKVNDKNQKLSKQILSQNENAENPTQLIEIWTKKEAYFKFLGEKVFIPKKLDITDKNFKTYYIKLGDDNFVLSVFAEELSKIVAKIEKY